MELQDALRRLAELPTALPDGAPEIKHGAGEAEIKQVIDAITKAEQNARVYDGADRNKTETGVEGVRIDRGSDSGHETPAMEVRFAARQRDDDEHSQQSATGKQMCIALVRFGGPKGPTGKGRPQRIQRSKGKLLLCEPDMDLMDSSGDHGRSIDLQGATIMVGDWDRQQDRGEARNTFDRKDPEFKFALEIRKDPFKFTRDDVELSFKSAALAAAWEKRLIRGVLHRAKPAQPPAPPSSGAVSVSTGYLETAGPFSGRLSSPGANTDSNTRTHAQARRVRGPGLTENELQGVGKLFTFVSNKNVRRDSVDSRAGSAPAAPASVKEDIHDSGAGVGVWTY